METAVTMLAITVVLTPAAIQVAVTIAEDISPSSLTMVAACTVRNRPRSRVNGYRIVLPPG